MSILGFKEEWGIDALKREYVERVLSDVMWSHGYSRISLPIIEPLSSYTEAVVGKSPWPEWNEKCIFKFKIDNYTENYESADGGENDVCLIPEGTVSITRWLASMIETGALPPKRLFYCLKCYRNELISTLSNTKCREFQQFGVEILDSSDIKSDIEILELIITLLRAVGVEEDSIKIRINDVALFNKLVEYCHISANDIISLKKNLDYLAECYAGKHPEDYLRTQDSIRGIITKYSISEEYQKVWDVIINHSYNSISEVISLYPNTFKQEFLFLQRVLSHFKGTNSKIELDLSVIRSHQYYSGISFEVDVLSNNKKYFEVAGGGRYDRLVGAFLKSHDNSHYRAVPCTGFAFGMDRVISMLDELGLLSEKKEINSVFNIK